MSSAGWVDVEFMMREVLEGAAGPVQPAWLTAPFEEEALHW